MDMKKINTVKKPTKENAEQFDMLSPNSRFGLH